MAMWVSPANETLIGRPDSRHELDTPVLLLDLDVFESNLQAMASFARERGIGLRPHAKTHKCAEIARRQQKAGAVGICCAKLSEAEALAARGIDQILLTSPVVSKAKIDRLLALNTRLNELAVVIDDPENAEALGAAVAASGQELDVLIVVDAGSHRFGVTNPEAALELGRVIARHPCLTFKGVQGYAGHVQHIVDYEERRRADIEGVARLRAARDALVEAGFPCPIVTGAGTGTHDMDPALGLFTDLQVGSYIFMDVDYAQVAMTSKNPHRFDHSLFVLTQVVSNRQPGMVTTDAGSKCFALDGPKPIIARGAPSGSCYAMFGDQFGKVLLPANDKSLHLGSRLEVIVPHCDPTVNLYDAYHCVRGDVLEAIWPIDGRGGVW